MWIKLASYAITNEVLFTSSHVNNSSVNITTVIEKERLIEGKRERKGGRERERKRDWLKEREREREGEREREREIDWRKERDKEIYIEREIYVYMVVLSNICLSLSIYIYI